MQKDVSKQTRTQTDKQRENVNMQRAIKASNLKDCVDTCMARGGSLGRPGVVNKGK